MRLAAGDCLGEASKILGAQVWDAAKKAVLGNINTCWVSPVQNLLSILKSCKESGWHLFAGQRGPVGLARTTFQTTIQEVGASAVTATQNR